MEQSQTVKSWQINVVIALLVLLLGALAFQALDARRLPAVQKWEYKVGSVPDAKLSDTINDLGIEGWELVFARRAAADVTKPDYMYEMIFRRPILPTGKPLP